MQTSSESSAADFILPPDVDLHARPAANFVRAAMRFSSDLWISSGEREADAKSLLSVLALGARRGTRLRLRAEGDDAAAAISTLVATGSQLQE